LSDASVRGPRRGQSFLQTHADFSAAERWGRAGWGAPTSLAAVPL